MANCDYCTKHAGLEFAGGAGDGCGLLMSAYILAGLAMMLNIRLSYSSAPYALIRFRLPENLFSVFVRRMASSLELWCLPGFIIADIMDLGVKGLYNNTFLPNTLEVLKDKAGSSDSDKLRGKAKTLYTQANLLDSAITASSDPGKKAAEDLKNAVGDNEGSGLTKALQQLAGDSVKAYTVRDEYNKVKKKYEAVQGQNHAGSYASQEKGKTQYPEVVDAWNAFNHLYHDAISPDKFHLIVIPSIIAQWLNFLTYVILLIVYRGGGEQGHLTRFYWTIAISGFVFGISNPLVYAVDYNYIPIYIAGENCFPALTSFIHYLATLMFGNRRKWNSDYLIVYIDIWVAIIISFAAAVVWTLGYGYFKDGPTGNDYSYGHIFTYGFGDPKDVKASMAAPFLIVLVGMGLVYAIYPGIAPGMIVPFYLIDKIEMVLLIATIFPPVIVSALRKKGGFKNPMSPLCEWEGGTGANWGKGSGAGWHFFDLIIPIMIILAYIFIYSLHYMDSQISRAIVNQPKMSTALTIIFYMCHEISLAVGFSGMIGNGAEYTVIAQMVGAFLMVFLALYSEGYIIEYKSHDPAHWPTEGMTKWNAFCYWCKRASKITNHNLRSLFTTDLRRDLLLCIQKNELI